MAAPNTISGLALWFHADDLAGLSDGASVTTWSSRVGTSAATAATTRIPTKQTVGSRTVVRLATDDRLTCSGDALTFSNNVAGVTVAVRAKIASASADAIFFLSRNGADDSSRCTLYVSAGGSFQSFGRRLDGDSATTLTAGTPSGNPENYSAVFDYSGNAQTHYIDNFQLATSAMSGAGSSSATNSAYVGIGGENAAGADLTDADIYEVVAYNKALSGSERTILHNWLYGQDLIPPMFFNLHQNMRLT